VDDVAKVHHVREEDRAIATLGSEIAESMVTPLKESFSMPVCDPLDNGAESFYWGGAFDTFSLLDDCADAFAGF
jgi:hypothetical protein